MVTKCFLIPVVPFLIRSPSLMATVLLVIAERPPGSVGVSVGHSVAGIRVHRGPQCRGDRPLPLDGGYYYNIAVMASFQSPCSLPANTLGFHSGHIATTGLEASACLTGPLSLLGCCDQALP